MTRIEMEEMVASLLAEQRRLARFDLELRPDKLMLLKRLLYRLGWNRGVKMNRLPKKVVKMAKKPLVEGGDFPNIVYHAANAIDNPHDDTAIMSLSDHLQDIDHPAAQAFNEWVFGGKSMDESGLREFIHPKNVKGYHTRGKGVPETTIDPVELTIEQDKPNLWYDPGKEKLLWFGKNPNESTWHMREPTRPRSRYPFHGRPSKSRRKFSTSEVSQYIYHHAGLSALLQLVVGARHFLKNKPATIHSPGSTVKFSKELPKKLIRYAKVDKDMPAHHLIAGFPLEHFLRHLANDPKNTSTVRDLAYIALTGKNRMTGEVKDDTVSPALWALHDALQESDHPMAPGNKGTYNLMSAADKIHLDKYVHTALREIGEDIRRGPMQPPGEHHWQHRPEHVAMRISHYLDTKAPRDIKERERPLYERVHARVQELAPGTTPKDIDESLRRHAHRGLYIWHEETRGNMDNFKEESTKPYIPTTGLKSGGNYIRHLNENEKATRYARLKLSPPKPWKGPGGESMVEHSYHDEAGNKLGVVRVHPRNEGRHLYIHWIGPENAKAGESPNQLGPEAMRSLKEGLKVHYPDAEFISGKRIAGFRKEPEMVVKPMSRLPRRVIRFSTESEPKPRPGTWWLFPDGKLIPVDDHYLWAIRHGYTSPESNTGELNHNELDGAFSKGLVRVLHPYGSDIISENSMMRPNSLQRETLANLAAKRGAKAVIHHKGAGNESLIWEHSQEYSRERKVIRFASSFRGDFIEALRRIQSSNQQALHEVAARLSKQYGMEPSKTYNALYDTPHGATPGIAQAIYGNAAPEHIHAMGAWIGLTSNTPGYAVFHPRPNGPDSLYRFRQEGSGLDIRSKLDRIGVRERVMIPSRKGFDVLIPDKGSRLYNRVKNYTLAQKIHMEASPGHFSTIGSADQARAREMFRNAVVKSESKKMKRHGKARKYMWTEDALKKAIESNPSEHTPLLAYADYLEENNREPEANLIRRHIKYHTITEPTGASKATGYRYNYQGRNPTFIREVSASHYPDRKEYYISLFHHAPNEPGKLTYRVHHWIARMPEEEAIPLLKSMNDSGVKVTGRDANKALMRG